MNRNPLRRPGAALLAAAVLCCSGAAVALGQPVTVLSGIPHLALFDTAFDGSHGVAVGAAGEVVVSQDGGKTWTSQKSPSALSLLGVATAGGRSIAVGQMGLILTSDGGTWKQAPSEASERLMAVAMTDQGLAFAVGAFGTVLKSTDAGATWSNAAPAWGPMFANSTETLGDSFRPHLYSVHIGGNGVITIAGELSFILQSADAGASWRIVHRGVNKDGHIDSSLFGMSLREDGVGFAVGQSGTILKTSDGGSDWSPVESGSQANLLGVLIDDKGAVIVPGMRETLTSADAGLTWRHAAGGDFATAWYSGIARAPGVSGVVVVGQGGKILSIPQ
jgi:photosystem II stability/assembly factor-like uncharacterized protein